jgi:uroporphyrinogen-III synthase
MGAGPDPTPLTGFSIVLIESSEAALLERLRAAGAEVATVPLPRSGTPSDETAVRRTVHATCAGMVDAVVFTSAPASTAFLDAAAHAGRYAAVIAAMQHEVVAAAVGPVSAAPLRQAGLEPLVPERHRLSALVRAVADHLEHERVREVSTEGGVLQLRGQIATLDGEPLHLSPIPLAMLRALARTPGEVIDRHRLLTALPGTGDLHAVEMAISRLRRAMGRPLVVQTVVRRGYRLCVAQPGR